MGCDVYTYASLDTCTNPKALGWIAVYYFVIFIIIGSYVLMSLFLGIIITSMDLLKETIKEEDEVRSRVEIKKIYYRMSDGMIENLLEIFDLIDTGANGKLTVSYNLCVATFL